MSSLYIIRCVWCGRSIRSNNPCIGEKVICMQCSLESQLVVLKEAGIEGSKVGIAFRDQLDKLFIRMESDKMLDKIVKQAIKEDNIKMWYQKLADYIKKFINILRLWKDLL